MNLLLFFSRMPAFGFIENSRCRPENQSYRLLPSNLARGVDATFPSPHSMVGGDVPKGGGEVRCFIQNRARLLSTMDCSSLSSFFRVHDW